MITERVGWRTADLPPHDDQRTADLVRRDAARQHHSAATPSRTGETTRTQLDFALPALAIWAADHDSLREISRDDFLAILPASGTPRAVLITGVRSIFRILKARKVVFTGPTYRVPGAEGETGQPLPVDVDTLRTIIDSDDPARAALVTFHALRTGDLTSLQLTDIHDGRLHLHRRAILLAPPVRHRLDTWLTFRARRYPNTANPHLFVTYKSALHPGPVLHKWISEKLGIPRQSHPRRPHLR